MFLGIVDYHAPFKRSRVGNVASPPPPPPITPDLKKLMFHYRYIKNKVNYEIKNANISY